MAADLMPSALGTSDATGESTPAREAPGWVLRFRSTKRGTIGLALLAVVVLACIVGPWVSPHDAVAVDPTNRLQGPSGSHWLGTDQFGRDVITRTLHGGRASLIVALSVTVIAMGIGTVLGLLAAMFRRADGPLMRFLDALMAFPSVLLAIALMARLGPSLVNVIAALSIVTAPTFARLIRSSALVVKETPYVELAQALGLRRRVIMTRYLFANARSPMILAATFGAATVILAEAALSFLGAGLPATVPTWGGMLNDGQTYLRNAWWLALVPGILLSLLLLSLNMVGDALRDALDPRSDRL
ncbi:MAG: ABC transporter permease [Propionibacteriaceae bacterium]